MRTTLDIDADVLTAAKELARAKNLTAGKVISELARKALTNKVPQTDAVNSKRNGFPILSSEGNLVTVEMVDKLIEAEDF